MGIKVNANITSYSVAGTTASWMASQEEHYESTNYHSYITEETQNIENDFDLNCGSIRVNEMRATTLAVTDAFTYQNRFIRSSCPVMYLHGDPFLSLNSNFIVLQGHKQKIVLCTMARLPGNDEDQAWIIQPGYKIKYKILRIFVLVEIRQYCKMIQIK
ncbi:MAG: hypothetical protein EOP47_23570 [Sphingobacteriaceae bacterium]|nr:MAG: hypothetical protein EOP47_23570 [Sphingobacteriaceae bacterium]